MLLLVCVSGAIWALDALVLAKRRRATSAGEDQDEASGLESPPSRTVEYAKSFFPVFLAVFLLRSFLYEPFRIPSGSMMPTLLIGDFILVNKFDYGIRLPVLDFKIVEIGSPARGDVVVFRYPKDPSTPFIKRVVGLPGDEVGYYDKVLHVNGTPVAQDTLGVFTGVGPSASMTGASHRRELLGDKPHDILIQTGYPSAGGKMTVPQGHYFVLGDNRDNSRDSRYWGTVPDQNLIGRAFGIWMHWDGHGGVDWPRIGDSIE